MPAEWAGRPVLVRWQLERPMYDFKKSFSPAFVYIHRAKYIFSRDMFCLPHFWPKIHGVLKAIGKLLQLEREIALKGDKNFWLLDMNIMCHTMKIHNFYHNTTHLSVWGREPWTPVISYFFRRENKESFVLSRVIIPSY